MASSSASSKSQGMLKRKCLCGLPTVILTSNTIRNPGRRFFRCMHYQDPSRDCNFFRWVDEGRNSRSDATTISGSDARSHIQKHEEIISDFGELLHCVTALKEAHLAETADWKQKHKALKEEVRGLKEAGLRRDMEASIMKKNQSKIGNLSPILDVWERDIDFTAVDKFSDEWSILVKTLLLLLFAALDPFCSFKTSDV
ncbi:hypothetical protein ACLOJK_012891 [Asimina triloba]